MNVGDTFTITGLHRKVRNGKRKWWQFWKPRHIQGPLRVFKIHSISPPISVKMWTKEEFDKTPHSVRFDLASFRIPTE